LWILKMFPITNFRQKKRGFTLIELLVVISLIGILMGILLVSYQWTRKSARDGRRKADLEQIRSALEIYRADCGKYPDTSRVSFGSALTSVGPPNETCAAGTTYMASVPQDPLYPTYQYRYSRLSTSTYVLCALLEGETAVTGTCTGANCGGSCKSDDTACNYKVCNP